MPRCRFLVDCVTAIFFPSETPEGAECGGGAAIRCSRFDDPPRPAHGDRRTTGRDRRQRPSPRHAKLSRPADQRFVDASTTGTGRQPPHASDRRPRRGASSRGQSKWPVRRICGLVPPRISVRRPLFRSCRTISAASSGVTRPRRRRQDHEHRGCLGGLTEQWTCPWQRVDLNTSVRAFARDDHRNAAAMRILVSAKFGGAWRQWKTGLDLRRTDEPAAEIVPDTCPS